MYESEMGFSLVADLLVKAKKPLIGHNMIYDILYLYNQFFDKLPETYEKFIEKVKLVSFYKDNQWYELFPFVFDTKVLACRAEYFSKNDLASLFNKCQTDNRLKFNCFVNFDRENGLNRYEGSSVESQHHEAAFDAYMTGHTFPIMLKHKDKGHNPNQFQKKDQNEEVKRNFGRKPQGNEDQKSQDQDGKGKPKPQKTPANIFSDFGLKCLNQTMLNQYDNMRVFYLQPSKHSTIPDRTWEDVAWIEFDPNTP